MSHQFEPEEAKKYGVNAAVILSNITHWIVHNKANNKHYHDDRTWTFNSLDAFCSLFPYLSVSQIRTALSKLIDDSAILTGNYNKKGYDRTKWYALRHEPAICQKSQMDKLETANGFAGNHEPIPDINTDNKQLKKSIKEKSPYPPEFEALWKAYPKRSGNNPKGSAFAAYKKQKDVHGHDALMDQVSKYAAYIQHVDHVQTEFVKHTSSFFGKDFDIDCQWDLPRQTANSTAKPSWSKIPQSDDDLWAWAKQHGYPDPGKAQDYYQYRATLKSVVEQRIGAEGLH